MTIDPHDWKRSIALLELVEGCGDVDCCPPVILSKQQFSRGKAIVGDGDTLAGAIVVIEGLVGRVRLLKSGARQIVSLLFPGDYISLTLEEDSATFGAVALIPSVIGNLGRTELLSRFTMHPTAYVKWMNKDAAVAREWCASTGGRRALARVAHFLCEYRAKQFAWGRIRTGFICPYHRRMWAIASA